MAKLFSWGANSHGQLSMGLESEMSTTPQEVRFHQSHKITHIAAGGGHILIRTSDNDLFTCGWNSKGQLGYDATNNSTALQPISAKCFDNKTISSLHCGWEESAVICDDGLLYVWGSNLYGQLGQSKDRKTVLTPTLLELPNNEKAISINFTFRCSVIVTSSGAGLLVGQLRHFDDLKKSENCTDITHNDVKFTKFSESVEKLASGQNHFVFVDKDNSVRGYGANHFGQTDRVVIGHQVDKILCGWKHNGVLIRTGDVLLWGRNTYGQLGRNTTTINIDSVRHPIRLAVFEKFKDFHLGAEHGLAVTNSGEIVTFGWNEHGNCGNGNVQNVYTPYLVNLPGKCVLAACGAGFCYALMEQ